MHTVQAQPVPHCGGGSVSGGDHGRAAAAAAAAAGIGIVQWPLMPPTLVHRIEPVPHPGSYDPNAPPIHDCKYFDTLIIDAAFIDDDNDDDDDDNDQPPLTPFRCESPDNEDDRSYHSSDNYVQEL